jgi:hypothetical protein
VAFEIYAPAHRTSDLQQACERLVRQLGHPEFPANAVQFDRRGRAVTTRKIPTHVAPTPQALPAFPTELPVAA